MRAMIGALDRSCHASRAAGAAAHAEAVQPVRFREVAKLECELLSQSLRDLCKRLSEDLSEQYTRAALDLADRHLEAAHALDARTSELVELAAGLRQEVLEPRPALRRDAGDASRDAAGSRSLMPVAEPRGLPTRPAAGALQEPALERGRRLLLRSVSEVAVPDRQAAHCVAGAGPTPGAEAARTVRRGLVWLGS